MQTLFGGSSGKSSSSNKAFDYLKSTFSPVAGATAGASNAFANLLGLGGDPSSAMDQIKNTPGYQFQLGQGLDALTANNATKGLLNSGSAVRGAEQYGQGLASNYFQQYIQNLTGLGNLGLNAGQVISGAGNVQSQKNSSSNGLFSGLFGAGQGVFSDERLKDNVIKLGRDEHGLDWYEWDWNDLAHRTFALSGRARGVLAQNLIGTEHERAVGKYGGYLTVRYDLLPKAKDFREAA